MNDLPPDPFRDDADDPEIHDHPFFQWLDDARMLVVAFSDTGSLAALRNRLAGADRQDVESVAAFVIANEIVRDAIYRAAAQQGRPDDEGVKRWQRWLVGPANATTFDDLDAE